MARVEISLPEIREYSAQSPGFYFRLIAWSALPLLVAALIPGYFALRQEHLSLTGYLFFFSLSAGLLLVWAYNLLLYRRWSFQIKEKRITESRVFSSTELQFRSIKGVRLAGGPLWRLTFYPKNETHRAISLQLSVRLLDAGMLVYFTAPAGENREVGHAHAGALLCSKRILACPLCELRL